MDLHTTGEWTLTSGSWVADATVPGFKLQRTALGYRVSAHLSAPDIGSLFHANRSEKHLQAQFPPEFLYCSVTSERLSQIGPRQAAWIPPFGALPARDGSSSNAVGLQQNAGRLDLPRQEKNDGEFTPDRTIAAPPPGEYEFFAAQFGTQSAALIALDPQKGMLFAWLPAAQKWFEMQHAGALLLSDAGFKHHAWRCELAVQFNSKLYLSTQQGLARLTPDVASLTYDIAYFGDGAALAAPICFDGKIWVPVADGDHQIRMVNLDAVDLAGVPVPLDGGIELGAVGAPVSYGRVAVWACEYGQLRLHKQADSSVKASFIPWPAGIAPQFQFGCPYLARDGALWQLCFDSRQGSYLYLKLGASETEMVHALAPRCCSGSVNYRFAVKLQTPPWEEPELGNDAVSSEVVMPLIEFGALARVIGLKFDTPDGLATALASNQRRPAQLVLDDGDSEEVFHTFSVSEPWRLRLFVYDDTVWMSHPMLNRIDGWKLQG